MAENRLQSSAPLPDGTMLGRYRLDAVIGRGQTGIVYRAFDTTLERTVALKRLRTERTDQELGTEGEEGRFRLLLEEAKVIGQLNHPHIAAVYDLGSAQGAAFIVMEYVEGETLKARIPRAPADSTAVPKILSFIGLVARALHYVHQRGILHGDIKPANILVNPQGFPKIMDFGVAQRSLSPRNARWSLAGEQLVWGTPGYVAPEQLVENEIDARADVFSLGVIAYEWLGGRKPFQGDGVEATLSAVLNSRPPPLSAIGDFHSELSEVINQALARRPRQRFASADAFADALEICQDRFYRPVYRLPAIACTREEEGKLLRNRNLLFADFTPREISSVLRLSRTEHYEAGEVIVHEGAGGSTLFVVACGSVSVRKRAGKSDIELARIAEGDCFGEMAVISQMPRSASVVALEPTEVIVISGALLRSASSQLSMKLFRNIAAVLSDRLRQLDTQLGQALARERSGQPKKRPVTP